MTEKRDFLTGLLAMYLSREEPKSIGLVLSHLDALLSASVLNKLPEEMQGDVILYMASGNFDESVSQEVNAILLKEILNAAGGPKIAALLLNETGRSAERRVLEHLNAQDPKLAEDVRNQMFTFDDIAKMPNREIQIILKAVDEKNLVIALMGASEEMLNRICANLSEETRNKIEEQMESSKPILTSDVEEVQLRIVQTVRQLEEEGKVTIVRGRSSMLV